MDVLFRQWREPCRAAGTALKDGVLGVFLAASQAASFRAVRLWACVVSSVGTWSRAFEEEGLPLLTGVSGDVCLWEGSPYRSNSTMCQV